MWNEKPKKTEKEPGDKPAFKGNGVAVWINKTKEGEDYLSINMLDGSIRVNAFRYEPRE